MASRALGLTPEIAHEISAFQLVTGYLVIVSEGLETTMVIDGDLRLLEVRPGLSDNHMRACLKAAYAEIGSDHAAGVFSARLGWGQPDRLPTTPEQPLAG